MDLALLQDTILRLQFLKAHVALLQNDPTNSPARTQYLIAVWNILDSLHRYLVTIKKSKSFYIPHTNCTEGNVFTPVCWIPPLS